MRNKNLDWPLCSVDAIALCRLENVVRELAHATAEFHVIDGLIADLHKEESFLSEEDYQTLLNLNDLANRFYQDIINLKAKVDDARD